MNVKPTLLQTSGPLPWDDASREAVSALVDGELSGAELDRLLNDGNPSRWTDDWRSYQLISEVLKGSAVIVSPRSTPSVFAAGITSRLQARTLQSLPGAPEVVVPPFAAANDAVFRWKVVAGLASVAAVAAMGWALVGTESARNAPGPQLAQSSPAPTADVVQPVVVQTLQGEVLRDARLEQLLAEHRQYGGMSALQTPTGFLRNATYDVTSPR